MSDRVDARYEAERELTALREEVGGPYGWHGGIAPSDYPAAIYSASVAAAFATLALVEQAERCADALERLAKRLETGPAA